MKKFMKKTEGFTLVELIVVIAILGILAGVGTVGYSGYIKKANQAADRQLIDTINNAYAVACLQEGVDSTATTASATIADKKLDSIAVSHTKGAEIAANFSQYYADNANAEFKVAEQLYFVGGAFVADFDLGDGGVYSELEFDPNDVNTVKLSAFYTASGLGVNGLMDKVDYITGLASSLADQTANEGNGNGAWQMLQNYTGDMLTDLGIVVPDNYGELSEEEQIAVMAPLNSLVNSKIAAMEKQGGASKYEDWDENKSLYAQNEILASYAVLDAAKQMQGQSAATVLGTIKSTSNFTDLIKNSDNGVSQAAAAYALYTAYAYSMEEGDARDAAIAAANDPVTLLKSMDDAGFRSYLDTDAATTDLAGYMAAMEMVNTSASNKDAVNSLLVNGFTDPALLAVLQQTMK